MVANHQHVEMLFDGVDRERPRRVGRGRQDIRLAGDADDVGRVTAARAFGVIGVDGAARDGADRVFDKAGFVERVGVNGDLDVEFVGDLQAGIDRGGCGAPVFVQLEANGARAHLFAQRFGESGVAFASETKIHRKRFGGFEHPRQCHAPGVQVVALTCPPPGRCRRRSWW